MASRLALAGIVAGIALSTSAVAAEDGGGENKAASPITFDEHVRPIFRDKCVSCHNSDDRDGDLDLSTYRATFEGGDSGAVIERGDPLNSSLYALVTHETEPAMPPESPKLPAEMLDTIKLWIEGGALENSGSQVTKRATQGLPLKLATRATGRPNTPPMPLRMVLEPVVATERGDVVRGLAVNPWSPLAAISSPKQIVLYNTETLAQLGVLNFAEGVPEVLHFSDSGALLLAGGGRGGARGKTVVWDVKTGDRVIEVGDELDTVLAADISSDHALIALGGPKRVVRVYSTEDSSLKHELRKHVEWIYDAEFSPDTALLATADRSGGIIIWEAWSGQEYLTLKGHGPGKIDLAWRSDSNVLASCGADGSVRLWEMEKGKQVGMWNAHKGGAVSVAFTPDGRLITCGQDNLTTLWDGKGNRLRDFENTKETAIRTAWCETTGRVLTGDFSGRVTLWDSSTGKPAGSLVNNPPRLLARLKAAEARVAETATLIAQRQKQVADAEAALARAKENAEANSGLVDARRRVEAARTVLYLQTEKKREIDEDITRLEKRVVQIERGLPNLQEAVRRADRSIKQMGGDPEVRKVEQELRTLARRRLGELNNSKRDLEKQIKASRNLDPAIHQLKGTLATAERALEQARKEAEPLRVAVREATRAVETLRQNEQQEHRAAIDATRLRDHWNGERYFAKRLREYATKQIQLEATIDEQRTIRDQHLAKKNQLHSELTAINRQMGEAGDGIAESRNMIDDQLKELTEETRVFQNIADNLRKLFEDQEAVHATELRLKAALEAQQTNNAAGNSGLERQLAETTRSLAAIAQAISAIQRQKQDSEQRLRGIRQSLAKLETSVEQFIERHDSLQENQDQIVTAMIQSVEAMHQAQGALYQAEQDARQLKDTIRKFRQQDRP